MTTVDRQSAPVVDFLPYLKRKLIRELITNCSEVMTEWIEEASMPRQLKNLYGHFDRLDLRALKELRSDEEGLQNFINIQFSNGNCCIACKNFSSESICKLRDETRAPWGSCKVFIPREDHPPDILG